MKPQTRQAQGGKAQGGKAQWTWIRVLIVALAVAPASLASPEGKSEGPEMSGGTTTVFDAGHNAFGRALANLEPSHWPLMREGKRLFVHRWQPGPGQKAPASEQGSLGPLYVADSCQACHFKDGRGGVPLENPDDPMGPRVPTPPPLVHRLSQADPNLAGSWRGDPRYGVQLQTSAIDGETPEATVQVSFAEMPNEVPVTYQDRTPVELLSPRYQVNTAAGLPLDETTSLSPRTPPTLVGMGLLEAIDPAEILAWEDPDDLDADGISGRVSWVPTTEGLRIGRFGWKAGQPTLRHQVVAALAEDMGVLEDLEISQKEIAHLTLYLQLLAPPARRHQEDPTVLQGQKVFSTIGCNRCHRPTLTTLGPEAVPGPAELANQRIHPYTDLLLHDLGPALADAAGEGSASGSEWRTPPLWGLGLLEKVNGVVRLLHDGRARGFEEAILWHGGEAQQSRELFTELPTSQRTALLEFVKSL